MDVLKFATVAISRQEVSKRRRQACLEAQLNHIFKEFELILREGLDLMDPSGQAHVVFAYPAIVLADNMDIWSITCVLGGDCAACRRRKGSLLDTTPAPLRTTQTEQPLVQRVLHRAQLAFRRVERPLWGKPCWLSAAPLRRRLRPPRVAHPRQRRRRLLRRRQGWRGAVGRESTLRGLCRGPRPPSG